MQPLRPDSHLWNNRRHHKGPNELTCATTGITVGRDDELFLSYGSHSNVTLFVEYGFVNDLPEEEWIPNAYPGEVLVDDLVMAVFEDHEELYPQLKSILEKETYWG